MLLNPFNSSQILIVGNDNDLKFMLNDWLSIHGWSVDRLSSFDRFQIIAAETLAIVLIDSRVGAEAWTNSVAKIRDLDGPVAGVPMILLDAETPRTMAGVSDFLELPLDRIKTLAMIEQWCGPLEDHGFRSLSNPHYRLTRLSGRTVADDLLGRFADQLEGAMDYLDHPDRTSSIPHQLTGLAGMIGYDALSRDWRAIDDGKAVDYEPIRFRMTEAIEQIRAKIFAR
jgi:hypothetical protein